MGKESQSARTTAAQFERNHLLASLPEQDRQRWLDKLDPVTLQAGEVLHQPQSPDEQVYSYFPVSAIVALLWQAANGDSAQTAVVGREGMLDVSVCFGGEPMPVKAIVQQAGLALRVPCAWLQEEFQRSTDVRRMLMRHAQSLIAQAAQAAACNRHHTIQQQLCRWLLLSLDRTNALELTTTQELIAVMLGVRREGVNEAAGQLQRAGMIAHRRGRIAVLDRGGLERRSCECYAQANGEFRRLLIPVNLRPELLGLHLEQAAAGQARAMMAYRSP
ncbi:Crp/Fnr family transcriptional regulator [Ramlibacter solisilvae]|uniref:Crp/Fnr family transcriptional regulator n=1 Tax=Ramlibacter tataouinensis TaxID=94132 RepID=UPI0009EE5260|nr:Crp/Fnr family transcriptional regulator [Ramlibacter tataouinensis]